jgi:uroporphyrinogen III methyltransferase/synthase
MSESWGKVYLVGAGPGDPGLITLRGRDVLEQADVVVYDNLANTALLRHAPRAETIFVGKSTDRHTLLQDEINKVLIEQASRVERVVRLKGGDSFVFGRGAEEVVALAERGIPFEVVPGVTAGIAAPAYAGIPVTHRGLSTSVSFITGHSGADGSAQVELGRLAQQGTLVFYMGMKNLPRLVEELRALGRADDTPAAVVEWGTYPRQRTVTATLATIAERAQAEGIEPPAVVIIGDVVNLHDTIAWYENRPLSGLRIVVTRARTQASEMTRRLRELGADVFEFPTIQIVPPEDPPSFRDIGEYDWVVLTSVNAVDMLFERLASDGMDARDLAGVKLCVVGSGTAKAVRKRALRVDLMPDQYVAEKLMEALREHEPDLTGKRFLLPRADIARSFLPNALREAGADLTEVVTYRTVAPETTEEFVAALVGYDPDLVVFMSSSAARNFHKMVGADRVSALGKRAEFASIGPKTTVSANDLAMPITVEPEQHDIPTLVDAINAWGKQRAHEVAADDAAKYGYNVDGQGEGPYPQTDDDEED